MDAPRQWEKEFPESVRNAAIGIAQAVAALQKHWDEAGDDAKAFDPENAETSQLFKQLWAQSFDRNFPPDMQEKIMAALERIGDYDPAYADTIARMRRIGHVSEHYMELGYAKRAITTARTMEPIRFEPILREYATTIAQLLRGNSRALTTYTNTLNQFAAALQHGEGEESLRDCMQRVWNEAHERWVLGKDDGDTAAIDRKAIEHAMAAFNSAFADLYGRITKDFPYKTYLALSHGEQYMMASLAGLTMRDEAKGTLLLVEAGPLPETAIYQSISLGGGRVICTNRDAESCRVSRELISELEDLGILEPGRVQVVQADPLSPDFRITDKDGKEVKPYAAIVSQLVDGRAEAQAISQKLVGEHGINTVVVRGAHHLCKLLYEPLEGLDLPNGVECRYTAVPKHARPLPSDTGKADQVLQHERMCYNTSHVYSSLERAQGAGMPVNENYTFAAGAGSQIIPGRR